MKKYFAIAALTTLALVACTEINPENVNDNPQEVSFEVAKYVSQTKAGEAELNSNIHFGTYAWYNDGANNFQAFMSNQEISKQGGIWKAVGQTYYWPKTGSVDFISYAPYDENHSWIAVAADKLTLTANNDIDAAADYLYADKAVGLRANNNPGTYNTDGVPTLFHHALSQVSVIIKVTKDMNGADEANSDVFWEVKLMSASIENISVKGSVELTPGTLNGVQTPWTLPSPAVWSASEFDKAIEIYKDANGQVIPAGGANKLTLLDKRSVMPQALSATAEGQALKLTFSLKTTMGKGSSAVSITENYPVSINLCNMSGAPKNWEMNKSITYTVTVDPQGNEILFDPAVTAWEEANGESTVVVGK